MSTSPTGWCRTTRSGPVSVGCGLVAAAHAPNGLSIVAPTPRAGPRLRRALEGRRPGVGLERGETVDDVRDRVGVELVAVRDRHRVARGRRGVARGEHDAERPGRTTRRRRAHGRMRRVRLRPSATAHARRDARADDEGGHPTAGSSRLHRALAPSPPAHPTERYDAAGADLVPRPRRSGCRNGKSECGSDPAVARPRRRSRPRRGWLGGGEGQETGLGKCLGLCPLFGRVVMPPRSGVRRHRNARAAPRRGDRARPRVRTRRTRGRNRDARARRR